LAITLGKKVLGTSLLASAFFIPEYSAIRTLACYFQVILAPGILFLLSSAKVENFGTANMISRRSMY
jgi:hypothetical protein